jgi:hypothetical protein
MGELESSNEVFRSKDLKSGFSASIAQIAFATPLSRHFFILATR